MTTEQLLQQTVSVCNPMGLHTRPAAELVKIASGFNAEITLEKVEEPGEEADCRSILSLLMLAAADGTRLKLRVSGAEAEQAMRAVTDFFESRFGEE